MRVCKYACIIIHPKERPFSISTTHDKYHTKLYPNLGYLPNDSEVARYGARTTPVVVTAYSLNRSQLQRSQPAPEKRRWWA